MDQQAAPQPKNRNVFFVGLLSFFGGVSLDIFLPILPAYYTSILGFNKTFVGVAEGLGDAMSYISDIAAGFFSDKFKKQKPVIFVGYFLSMISRPLLAVFTSPASVIGLRVADGTGRGIKDPPKDVLIAGSAKKETRGKSFGIARMLDTLGSVVGPLILFGLLYMFKGSGFLYHSILIFTAVPLLLTLFIIVVDLREVGPQSPAPPRIGTPEAKPRLGGTERLPKSFFLFLAIVLLFALGSSSDAFLILRAQNLGVPLLEIPLVIALFNFIYAMFAVPFGSLSDRIGRIPTIAIGWLAYALVYLGFAIAARAIVIWFLYGFYGIYYAIDQGVSKALLADMVGSGHRGRAFGIYGMTVGFSTLLASFLAGFLWDRVGPQAPFYLGAAVAVASVVLLSACSKRLKPA